MTAMFWNWVWLVLNLLLIGSSASQFHNRWQLAGKPRRLVAPAMWFAVGVGGGVIQVNEIFFA